MTGVTAGANSFLTTNGSNVPGLTTIASDTFTQYALLAGRGTGQLLYGGTNPSANLTLASTSNGTKGKILFGTSGYDEVNNRLGLGMTNPAYTLDITGTFRLSTTAPVFGAYTLNMVNNASLSGTNTGDMSLGTNQNGLSLAGQVLSMGTASTSTTGALTNTDWNTFNSKLSSIGIGTTVSSATAGSVFFAGTGGVLQQDNPNFFWDDAANRLGLGMTNPAYTLDITGTFRLSTTAPVFGAYTLNMVNNASLSGTNTGDMSLGTNQNGLSLAGQVLSMGTASTSTTGALTNTDWNTFNSKLSSIGIGTTVSSATAGSVFFAGTGGVLQQDNPNFFWDDAANRLGIGRTAPGYTLDINGNFRMSNTQPVFGAAIITVPATGTMVLGTGGTNQIAYWSDANTLTGVTAGANSFLTTNGSNVPGLTTIASDTFTQYALLAGRGYRTTPLWGNQSER